MSECEEDWRQKAKKWTKGKVYTYVLQIVLSGSSVQESVSPENSSTEMEIARYGREDGCGVV